MPWKVVMSIRFEDDDLSRFRRIGFDDAMQMR
jgi:hypothetical protein